MARSFTSQDLVALPRLNAAESVVLATELITVADARERRLKPKKLPEAIGRSKGRLVAAVATLEALTRPQGGDPVETKTKPKADRLLDGAWSATFDWLGGWCKLPPERNPSLDEAKDLFKILYPDGLSFTRLPYKLEWKESKARLDALRGARHDRTFKKLGGEGFLAHLEEAHEAYGRALHITAPKPESAPTGDVRAAFMATLAGLRDYATRVAAHADPDVPGSEEVSAALLEPLAAWQSRPVGSNSGASDVPETQAEPAAPPEAEAEDEPLADPA
ncbi:hypothetical protein WME75_31755 [Sorangium sp. So ce1014]|uniref:hypothetical protein n=1 Tax=Sorangium sp. So ce1014 TaxID=3133326 RepID=UPI003F642DFB